MLKSIVNIVFLDTCFGKDCSNRGLCYIDASNTDGYKCDCNTGYKGKDCEDIK